MSDPFAGRPAEGYLDGAAGIVFPAARPVAGYSAAQIHSAYATTKRLLIAAELDRATLRGGRPRAFARLLTAQQRADFSRGLDRKGVGKNGFTRSTRVWVTSFAPGTAFVGSVIRVHGVMAARTALDNGREVLRIHFNYLFGYPVQRPGLPGTRMRIVTHASGNVDFAQWDSADGAPQPWWLAVGRGRRRGPPRHIGRLRAPEFSRRDARQGQPSGTPVNPYDLNVPLRHGNAKCLATTGT